MRLKYLHTVDVDPAHAAAAVNEEDKLAVNLPQVRADRLEVGAEVKHDHGVVEDVFVKSSVNDINLEKNRYQGEGVDTERLTSFGRKRDKIDRVARCSISIIADAGNPRQNVVSLWSVSIETHFYGQVLSPLVLQSAGQKKLIIAET